MHLSRTQNFLMLNWWYIKYVSGFPSRKWHQCARCTVLHTQAELSAASSQQRPEINKVILIDPFVEEADQSGAQMPQKLAYKLNSNEDQLDGIFSTVKNVCFYAPEHNHAWTHMHAYAFITHGDARRNTHLCRDVQICTRTYYLHGTYIHTQAHTGPKHHAVSVKVVI